MNSLSLSRWYTGSESRYTIRDLFTWIVANSNVGLALFGYSRRALITRENNGKVVSSSSSTSQTEREREKVMSFLILVSLHFGKLFAETKSDWSREGGGVLRWKLPSFVTHGQRGDRVVSTCPPLFIEFLFLSLSLARARVHFAITELPRYLKNCQLSLSKLFQTRKFPFSSDFDLQKRVPRISNNESLFLRETLKFYESGSQRPCNEHRLENPANGYLAILLAKHIKKNNLWEAVARLVAACGRLFRGAFP